MSADHPRRLAPALVLGAALVAAAVKLVWALHSRGSCDLLFFFQFGESLSRSTLAQSYARDAMFNHTPAVGLFLRWLYGVCRGDYWHFAAAFRAFSIAADLGTVAALLHLRWVTGRPAWWVLGVFALSPVSLMVSGFHGNLDPVLVALLTWAAVAAVRERPVLCGVLLGAASNVKVLPLILVPVFLAYWWPRGRRGLMGFTAALAALLLAGSLPLFIEAPGLFLHKVLGYGSYWGTWGITYWLKQTGQADFQTLDFQNLSAAQNQVVWLLKALMVGGIALLAWRRRSVQPAGLFTTLAAAFAIIFAFAPGAGPQYLVWFAPFLLYSEPLWYLGLTACSTIFMVTFYHSTAAWHFPWDLACPNGWDYLFWSPWTNLPWLVFVLLLATKWRAWWVVPREL